MNRRNLILWGPLLIVLVAANALIYDQERLRAEGDTVYLELAPVDPRSLMQGDYMILSYTITQDIERAHGPDKGRVVIRLDERGVGHFVRLDEGRSFLEGGRKLADDERLLRYEIRPTGIQIGAESFFFEEGRGGDYATARYAELRVNVDGEAAVVALRDEDFKKLGSD